MNADIMNSLSFNEMKFDLKSNEGHHMRSLLFSKYYFFSDNFLLLLGHLLQILREYGLV